MMERLKDGSQVSTVVMRRRRPDRRLAAGLQVAHAVSDDVERQAEAGEEDQSAHARGWDEGA